MDLLPFVKKLGILSSSPRPWILPRRFDRRNLLYFSALTNVQQLRIERFNLSKFTSDVERYFGHFAPTLRSISLITSSGTQRQLLCFLALFPNLDDIEIAYYLNAKPSTITKPVPKLAILPSVPSLRGQLKLTCFRKEIMARDMITFFGGLRFQYMDLYGVEGSQLLLEACAGTLQTVRINPIALNSTEPVLTPTSYADGVYRNWQRVAPRFRSIMPPLPSVSRGHRLLSIAYPPRCSVPPSRYHFHDHVPCILRSRSGLPEVGPIPPEPHPV